MPKRIDSLTDAQRARFPEWVAKWIKIGLSTERADRKRFEKAVAVCYRETGLEPPKKVVWVTSPLALAFAAPTAAFLIEMHKNLAKKDLDASVRASVGTSVGASVS